MANMNKIDIDNMSDENIIKKIYSSFRWQELDAYIDKSPYKEKSGITRLSHNSYSFYCETETGAGYPCSDGMKKYFNISNDYKSKIDEATGGAGKEELWKLHSPVLPAFLHFFQVGEEKPIIIKINGKEYEFTDVHFEVANPAINGIAPSHTDVVLVSKNKKVILCLESEFSEYLASSSLFDPDSIKSYLKIPITGKIISKNYSISKGKYGARNNGREIEQLIKHYYGIYNRSHGESSIYDKCSLDYLYKMFRDPCTRILFGSIIFDKWPKNENKKEGIKAYAEVHLKIYENEYRRLQDIINRQNDIPKFKIPGFEMIDCLKYSDVFKQNEKLYDDTIPKLRSFYRY